MMIIFKRLKVLQIHWTVTRIKICTKIKSLDRSMKKKKILFIRTTFRWKIINDSQPRKVKVSCLSGQFYFSLSPLSRIYNKRLIIKLDFITSSSSRFNRPIIAHFFLHWLSATVLLSSINWQGDKKQNPFFFFFFFCV